MLTLKYQLWILTMYFLKYQQTVLNLKMDTQAFRNRLSMDEPIGESIDIESHSSDDIFETQVIHSSMMESDEKSNSRTRKKSILISSNDDGIKDRPRDYFPIIPTHKQKKRYIERQAKRKGIKCKNLPTYSHKICNFVIEDANHIEKPLNLSKKIQKESSHINSLRQDDTEKFSNTTSNPLNKHSIASFPQITEHTSNTYPIQLKASDSEKINKLQDQLKNSILRPYIQRNENASSTDVIEGSSNFDKKISYLQSIGAEYGFLFTSLINNVNQINKKYMNEKSTIMSKWLTFTEFFGILKEEYNYCECDTFYLNDVVNLLPEFYQYADWLEKTFNFHQIESYNNTSSLRLVKSFNEIRKNMKKDAEEDLLDQYTNLFNSENYKILFEIIPGFNLLFKMKTTIAQPKNLIATIKYLQLIIYIFEEFRFYYFIEQQNYEVNLQELYGDFKFNQTLSKICMVFRKIIRVHSGILDESAIMSLENYCFLYFIGAYYRNISL